MFSFLVGGFVHTAFVELINGGAGVAEEYRGVGSNDKLSPATAVELIDHRNKRQYPGRRQGCFGLVENINTVLELVIK